MKIKLFVFILLAVSIVKSQDTIFKNTSFTINSSPHFFDDLVMEDNSSIIISSELREVEIHMKKAVIGKNCLIKAIPKHGERAKSQNKIPSKSSDCSNGAEGFEGIPGGNGENGCNIKLAIGIFKIGNLLFISHGGNGGYGGVGGKGGAGGDSDCTCHTTGGRGGRGGIGGRGGNGGKIIVEYSDSNPNITLKKSELRNIFEIDNERGYGEQGGEGGVGGPGNPEKKCELIGIEIGGGPQGERGIDKSNKWSSDGKNGPTLVLRKN